MGEKTGIQWTDATDNIIVAEGGGWWCRKFDDGCDECYAEKLNQNAFFGGNKLVYLGQPPALKLRTDIIEGWARKTKPKKRFVASMTDVCGEWVPREWVFAYLDGMLAAPSQTFQVLTKRGVLMWRLFVDWLHERGLTSPPPNIWAGVTLANQKAADRNRAAMRNLADAGWLVWASYEPALGPIDWSPFTFLRWIVSGGESGHFARPSHPDWHKGVRDFCAENNIPYFFKQHGEWIAIGQLGNGDSPGCSDYYRAKGTQTRVLQFDGRIENAYPPGAMLMFKTGKKDAGRLLDGVEHNAFPEVSQ